MNKKTIQRGKETLFYTPDELMVTRASRELKNGEVVFVGIGLPNLACNVARRLHAQDLILIYESGAVGAVPSRLPLSIGDPCLVTDSISICSMVDIFNYYLQGGLIDVGFLGGAQVDRFGNINSTVIGNYEKPEVRLPGSGGACDISINAGKVIIIINQSKRNFPDRIDFITSPGLPDKKNQRKEFNMQGRGPALVITDFGVYRFLGQGEMVLTELHPGISVEQVKETISWDIKIESDLAKTEPPTEKELRVIREYRA
ncbi:CoA-transferase subunit beta [Acidobacteriota bacterium]